MSADLWAAFGNGEDATSNPWSQPSPVDHKPSSQFLGHIATKTQSNSLVDLDTVSSLQSQVSPSAQSPWATETALNPEHNVSATNTLENGAQGKFEEEQEIIWTDFATPDHMVDPWAASRMPAGTEVLWDADQVNDDDDDFGDFEEGIADVSNKLSSLKVANAFSNSSTSQILETNQNVSTPVLVPKSRSRHERGKDVENSQQSSNMESSSRLPARSVNTSIKPQTTGSITQQLERSLDKDGSEVDEDWDEWSPDPTRKPRFTSTVSNVGDTQPMSSASIMAGPSMPHSSASPAPAPPRRNSRSRSRQRLPPISTLAPTNVPPPSILISLLSTLISTLPTQVEQALAAFTTDAESNTAADKALSTAVRKCLAALRVAARIVAGRKLRWKRDTHLSQSMRIGPAAAGGKGGMKLSGVDRNEIKREDREVAEFVRIWQAKLGSVRRALANVNSKIGQRSTGAMGKKLEIPSIAETMAVRTMTGGGDGGIRSVKACTLCGIKREERVDRVDEADVLDVSSEWWVEHWGHAECRAFWYQHEKYLQQR